MQKIAVVMSRIKHDSGVKTPRKKLTNALNLFLAVVGADHFLLSRTIKLFCSWSRVASLFVLKNFYFNKWNLIRIRVLGCLGN